MTALIGAKEYKEDENLNYLIEKYILKPSKSIE